MWRVSNAPLNASFLNALQEVFTSTIFNSKHVHNNISIENTIDIFLSMSSVSESGDEYYDDWSLISIPAIKVTHNKINFEYDGLLEYHGHCYDENMERFIPRVTLTKTGKVAKKQIQVPKQLVGWWRAQCVFRGLTSTGTIQELQDHLKVNPGAPMLQDLKNLEATARRSIARRERPRGKRRMPRKKRRRKSSCRPNLP